MTTLHTLLSGAWALLLFPAAGAALGGAVALSYLIPVWMWKHARKAAQRARGDAVEGTRDEGRRAA